ncbi:MAG: T9SS type A sorting domain-containing protein [Ferruginibacter sp.]
MMKPIVNLCCIAVCCSFLTKNYVPGITVVFDAGKKAVSIQWQQQVSGIKTFVVQRSANNSNWTDIAFQGVSNFNPAKTYQYLDYKAIAGQNYYRLKVITEKGKEEFSASVMIINGTAEANWVIYPVPVKELLTLQYKGIKKLTGVVNVFIHNVTGRIITRVRSASLNAIIRIPVDNLGSGIYDVRIIIENEVVWNQRIVK